MAAINEEDIIQIQVCEWVKQVAKIPVIGIANQRQCSVQYGMMLKRMGVRAGVSDLFFPRSSFDNHFKGLWLELKTKTGKPSQAQEGFLCDMIAENYMGNFAYGEKQAIEIIRKFYNITLNHSFSVSIL